MNKKRGQWKNLESSGTYVRVRYAFTRLFLRYEPFIQLTRLNRPIGIFLLLWPTLWALWIATEGAPDPKVVLIFVLGVILTRSAGCAMNDFADRKLDGRVKRTANRPLVTGRMKPGTALFIFLVLGGLALGLVYQLSLSLGHFQVLYFAAAGAFLIVLYPFTKRFLHMPQVVLGMAFAMSVPMAFVAVPGDPELPPVAWVLYLAVVLWTTCYDTMYALVDRSDDLQVGVKSTAILFGDLFRVLLGILHALVLFALVMVGDLLKPATMPYYVGLAAAAVLAGYQLFLVHDREPKNCFKAFLNNHWYGAAIFLGILYHYLIPALGYGVVFVLISTYIGSIFLVYLLARIKNANRPLWVLVSVCSGPAAIPLLLFARPKRV